MDESKLCYMPFMSLTMEANGDVKLCSSSTATLLKQNASQISIKELWESDRYLKIRNDFKVDVFPAECSSCKNLEDLGQNSRRKNFTGNREKKYGKDHLKKYVEHKPIIKHLSVAFSNDCNLKCAMCGGLYSSSWHNDEQLAQIHGINFRTNHQEKKFSMPEDSFNYLLGLTDNLDNVLIKGGEPFLTEKCLKFLEILNNKKSKAEIFVQTNGTIINEEILNLIRNLNISIGFSIDGTDLYYSWIRGYKLENVLNNIMRVSESKENLEIFIDITTSAFNVFDLPHFLIFYKEKLAPIKNVKLVSFTTIARQNYNELRVLPIALRRKLIDEIKTIDSVNAEGLEDLLSYLDMPQLDLKAQRQFKEWLIFLESSRGRFPGRDCLEFNLWIESI